jgi:hypothetical protein
VRLQVRTLAPLLGLGVLFAGTAAAAPEPSTRSYAVIVGSNTAPGTELAPLRYADDDAARYYELLSLTATRTELLTVLDAESQRLHPRVAAVARPPSRPELEAALERVFAALEADRRAGHRTSLYFVYVGHGSIGPDGEGAMHLLDGRFTRSDLHQRVLARSPATVNHVILDACHAYLMVARRGGEADAEAEAVARFLAREDLSAQPNTGILASTSRAAEVHEWSRFGAGVFSHEVRSALAGAADADLDGRVGYEEVGAFVSAANARVRDPRARLDVYVRPPALDRSTPLYDRRGLGAPTLSIPAALAGRYHLLDARGVRYADLHLGPDQPATLVLVPDGETYYLRGASGERTIPLGAAGRVDAAGLTPAPLEVASRGAEADTFRRDLFALPFSRAYLEGYRASVPDATGAALVAPPVGASRRWVALGLGSAAVLAAALGLGFALDADARAAEYRSGLGGAVDLAALKSTSERHAAVATGAWVGAGVLASAALTTWLWPE